MKRCVFRCVFCISSFWSIWCLVTFSWVTTDAASNDCPGITFVSRSGWKAKPSKSPTEYIKLPVPYVYIQMTNVSSSCNDVRSCSPIVRNIQYKHQVKNKYHDIGYHFLVAPYTDGARVYEGRGWFLRGALVKDLNSQSISVAYFGFNGQISSEMGRAKDLLISCGKQKGYLASKATERNFASVESFGDYEGQPPKGPITDYNYDYYDYYNEYNDYTICRRPCCRRRPRRC